MKRNGEKIMRACPHCGHKIVNDSKYCPKCNYYLGNYVGRKQVLPEYQPPQPAQPSTPVVQCPYCKSTNTKKITTTSKAVHTALFGIFSMGRNSKQWHCDNCGSDF